MMLPSSGDRVGAWIDENLHPFGGIAVAAIGSAGYLALLAWAWQHTSYDVWGALLVAPVLIALTIPIARRVAYEEGDRTMVRIIMLALLVKLAMTLVRYVVAFGVYGGNADAGVYHTAGVGLARMFRSGTFDIGEAASSGAAVIQVVTGIVYTLIGPTKMGGFLVFSWFGFWGLYLLYRAFRIALPDGDHRRYAMLVFFLPSMTFWPSSLGKEAWMSLMLGLMSYGIARTIAHLRGGFGAITLGIVGASLVRPHVALIFFLGIAIAYLLRHRSATGSFGALPKVVGVLVLATTGIFLLDRVQTYFAPAGLEEGESAVQVLDIAEQRTDEGGSAYEVVTPTSPTRFLLAVVTVLFRPFPNEAPNVQAMLTAAEGMFVLGLCLLSAPRLLYLVRRPRAAAYGWLALTYTLLFCYAFARIGNFGILTRQRVQVLPFLLVLCCLPKASRASTKIASEARTASGG